MLYSSPCMSWFRRLPDVNHCIAANIVRVYFRGTSRRIFTSAEPPHPSVRSKKDSIECDSCSPVINQVNEIPILSQRRLPESDFSGLSQRSARSRYCEVSDLTLSKALGVDHFNKALSSLFCLVPLHVNRRLPIRSGHSSGCLF